jgi:hypothetical protein
VNVHELVTAVAMERVGMAISGCIVLEWYITLVGGFSGWEGRNGLERSLCTGFAVNEYAWVFRQAVNLRRR